MIDYRVGDTREIVAAIPDGSVSLVATSPPFLALRSYLPADHAAKHAEIGSEPDPATFIDTLLGLTAEWGRVLAPWGSIAIELGDTYSGGTAEGTDTRSPNSQRFRGWADGNLAPKNGPTWPMPKSLALIPQLYAASLAYGRNVLRVFDVDELLDVMQWWADDGYTAHDLVRMARLWSQSVRRADNEGESPAGRWRVRNVIVWHRPNPAVGALGDKVRPSTSYIVVATKDARRWFDLTAVRGAGSPNTHARTARGVEMRETTGKTADKDGNFRTLGTVHSIEGAPPLDCWTDEYDYSHDTWTLTTQPSRLAHYAMWPARLAERLVLSMCPAEVCTACGTPRRRVERAANSVGRAVRSRNDGRGGRFDCLPSSAGPRVSEMVTTDWTDCGCEIDGQRAPFTPGTVLDPFAGTFTTGLVAEAHGRNAIGIDIDPRNAELVPLRRQEVRRNLFGSPRVDPAQLTVFDATEVA